MQLYKYNKLLLLIIITVYEILHAFIRYLVVSTKYWMFQRKLYRLPRISPETGRIYPSPADTGADTAGKAIWLFFAIFNDSSNFSSAEGPARKERGFQRWPVIA